jgi:hypothetical protein
MTIAHQSAASDREMMMEDTNAEKPAAARWRGCQLR